MDEKTFVIFRRELSWSLFAVYLAAGLSFGSSIVRDADETHRHFESVTPMLSTVLIDDFHSDSHESNGVYHSKNYEKILSRFGFVLQTSEISQHLIRDDFFKNCAKRLVFRRGA